MPSFTFKIVELHAYEAQKPRTRMKTYTGKNLLDAFDKARKDYPQDIANIYAFKQVNK